LPGELALGVGAERRARKAREQFVLSERNLRGPLRRAARCNV